jgi:hypothetical protein
MGFVYIFINDWMPKLVKIGITANLEQRLKESGQNTFVPCAFSCFYAIESEQYENLETFVHKTYDMFRVNDKREFFELEPETAKDMLKGLVELGLAKEIASIETEKLSDAVSQQLTASGDQAILRKRSRTTFKMLNIPIGTELVYKNDDKIVCKTIDDINQVECNGEIRSISNLSIKLTGSSTNGFEYFTLNNKSLGDMRRELDAGV